MAKQNHKKRLRYSFRRRTPPGTAPGTLVPDPHAPQPQSQCIIFSPKSYRQLDESINDLLSASKDDNQLRWINVDGLGNADVLKKIADRFELHPLAMEDVVNVHQRPKFEDYARHLFLILRMPKLSASEAAEDFGRVKTEQVSLCMGKNFVITFQEMAGDVFEPVRQRLKNDSSRLRAQGPDYLAYALIDSVIDAYFPVLESYGELVEKLEIEVVNEPTPEHMIQIHAVKRDLLTIRRAIWPMRDMLSAMLRDDNAIIQETTKVFLRDCHDHTIQLLDIVETYREITSGLVDVHLSSVSNRMNEVMKILTVIATIFIPLTFIAGVYGMNFDPEVSVWNMPELKWRYGYLAVMLAMAAIAIGLLIWFYVKGWLGKAKTGLPK
ncbi:MAG TPA: magnesium/cobalt transporter CorA [Pirellulaceae bacterium]|nr:magnesium/cobalt transporter CorA [Pirellulaceae bacterium]HMO90955.1 magnesium/cobalt transporter CorA [Pirellulaceae bacterium]HMP69853.1 magnesium/cobalt transporter CorA [Pirellulaceae bacterium]